MTTKITNIAINSTNRQGDQVVASVRVTLEETQGFIDLNIYLPQDLKKGNYIPNCTIGLTL